MKTDVKLQPDVTLADTVPSPAWHREPLATRDKRIAEGRAKYLTVEEVLETARKKLRQSS